MKKDEDKTKVQLMSELVEMRQRIAELEVADTERQRAEEALKQSEERYRDLFNLISDAVYVIDQETGRVLDVNVTACKMYGYTREEWLKMKNTNVSAEPAETRKTTKETPEAIPIRYHKKKDGTVFPLEMTLNTFDLKGRKTIVATARDITERQRAEAELLLKDLVFEASITANSISDNHGILTHVNSAFIKIWGYENAEEAVGKPISDFGIVSKLRIRTFTI